MAVPDWPVAPGVRRTIRVARHEVYAPEARMIRVDAGGEIEDRARASSSSGARTTRADA